MAISGQQDIYVGVVNQSTGSDDLYTAFNKVQNNFTQLFDTASPYNTFTGNGVAISSNAESGIVSITNTGVLSIIPGTGIAVTSGNGNVTISTTGAGGNTVAGVTNIAVTSNTLNVTGGPIVSRGVITVDLPTLPTTDTFAPGEYIAPTLTVDQFGRVSKIANTTSVGTVTSVAIASNGGLSVTGGPITESGTITLKNTGVTKITAGSGISVTGQTGDITISSTIQNFGTVTRVDVVSSSLTVTGGTIITSGTIGIELPQNISLTGKIQGANLVSTGPIFASGNITGANIIANANITANGTITSSNVVAGTLSGSHIGSFNGTIGATTANTGAFTTISTTGSISVGTSLTATGNVTATYIKGDGSQLTGISGPFFSAYTSGALSLVNNSGTIVKFAGIEAGSSSAYNATTGYFTPTVAGWYQLNASILPQYVSGTQQIRFSTYLYKNGSTAIAGGPTVELGSSWGVVGTSTVSKLVYFNGTTDYVMVVGVVFTTTGVWQVAASPACYFQAVWSHA